MRRASQLYASLVRRHPIAASCVAAIAVAVAASGVHRGHARQTAAYLAAVALGAVVTDLLTLRGAVAPLPVRSPRRESIVIGACWAVAMGWLLQRFVENYRPSAPIARLAWATAGLGCVFTIMPALWLLTRRYSPRDLGLRLNGLAAAIAVLAIFATIALTCAPASMTWREIRTLGPLDIAEIALSAALSEEFFRVIWQTRVGAWLRSPAAGWLIASIAWALLHFPKDLADDGSVHSALIDAIDIVPLGLLWGYLTHRARSFVPSAVLHACNVWGLQNL